jgi:hypothetical protein
LFIYPVGILPEKRFPVKAERRDWFSTKGHSWKAAKQRIDENDIFDI